jgi:hypothetical protein
LGKEIPYGVYDIDLNEAWVSVGSSRDTAEFAVEAIQRWWKQLGKERYGRPPQAVDYCRQRRQQWKPQSSVVVNLVSSTRTGERLEVYCRLVANQYVDVWKISDAQMESLRLKRNAFHGEWNYEILPRR